MRQHPVTPMKESDLRLHLAQQTRRSVASLDVLALHGDDPEARLEEIAAQGPGAVLFDGLDERSLLATGRLLWTRNPAPQTFAVGSSGLTVALITYWRSVGLIPSEMTPGDLKPVDRVVVISGSCSPMTEKQIRRAIQDGFQSIRIAPGDTEQTLRCGLEALRTGRSVVLYTALGPGDCTGSLRGPELGRFAGVLLRDLLLRSGARRAVVAGGDTSSEVVRTLGLQALTFAAQLAPGVPLCRAHSAERAMDGLELALKGGQVGGEDFFDAVLRGRR